MSSGKSGKGVKLKDNGKALLVKVTNHSGMNRCKDGKAESIKWGRCSELVEEYLRNLECR